MKRNSVLARRLACPEGLESRTCLTSAPMLLADTNSLPQGSNPHWITEFGTDVVFAVNDRQTGHSLWKTDGTDSGTEHLVTLRNDHRRFDWPDANPNEPLAVIKDKIVFTARDASDQSVLWSSDGTDQGSTIISRFDVLPEQYVYAMESIASNGSLLIFVSRDDLQEGQSELWTSDGTADGTQLITELGRGASRPHISSLQAMNGFVLFTADRYDEPTELWRSDGTAEGTFAITKFGDSYVALAPNATTDDAAYFMAPNRSLGQTNSSQYDLWKTDGTIAGTRPIYSLSTLGSPLAESVFTLGDRVIFHSGRSEISDDQLSVYDESDGSVVPLTLPFHSTASGFLDFERVGDKVYFSAYSHTGTELWSTDGTSAGTSRVWDFGSTGPGWVSSTGVITLVGDYVFFTVESDNGNQLWATNGTVTKYFHGIVNPLKLQPVGNQLYLSAVHPVSGRELMRIDADSDEVHLFKDISLGTADAQYQNWIAERNDHFFIGHTTIWRDTHIWHTNGQPKATFQLDAEDVANQSRWIRSIAYANDRLLFLASDERNGINVWQQNTRQAGSQQQVTDFLPSGDAGDTTRPQFRDLHAAGDQFYLTTDQQLWRLDKSSLDGASIVHDFGPDHAVFATRPLDDQLLTLVRRGHGRWQFSLYRTDTTNNATTKVMDLDGFPTKTVQLGSRLVIRLAKENDSTLWVTDGSQDGTHPLYAPQEVNTYVQYYAAEPSDELLFQVHHKDDRRELWSTDGTIEGTKLIIEWPDVMPYGPTGFVRFGDKIYFTGPNPDFGHELWVTDGTSEGTRVFMDINPGPASSDASEIIVHDDHMYFSANDGVSGNELWVTDGSVAGTKLAADVFPGERSSYPTQIQSTEFGIVFSADDGIHGHEPWTMDHTLRPPRRLQSRLST